jgi:hypothetical protein
MNTPNAEQLEQSARERSLLNEIYHIGNGHVLEKQSIGRHGAEAIRDWASECLSIARVAESILTAHAKELAGLSGYLERAGWGRCDIPACNCGGYHKLRESKDERELREAKDAELAELRADSVAKIQSLHDAIMEKDAEIREIKQSEDYRNLVAANTKIQALKDQLADSQKWVRELEGAHYRTIHVLRSLHHECLASDFNEHWSSYREADKRLAAIDAARQSPKQEAK